jgi:hypothetical protein
MEHEISTGRASAILVTNLPVACMEVDGDTKISPAVVRKYMEGEGYQPEPEVQRETTAPEPDPDIVVNVVKGQNERFAKGQIEDLAPDPGNLFRSEEGDTIQQPVTVELFPDGKPVAEPGKESVVLDDEDPMLAAKAEAEAAVETEAPAEKAEEVVEKEAPAEEKTEKDATVVEEKKEAPKKEAAAKTSTKKTSTRKTTRKRKTAPKSEDK